MGKRTRHDDGTIAGALAGAFLAADDWQPAAMGRLAKRAVADRRRWPRDVAEIVVRAFPDRPADRPRALADLIAATEPFRRAVDDPLRPVRVHHWYAAPTRMGPRRWPVPPIDDLAALAAWLGVRPGHLDWFADRRSLERSVTDERLRHHHRRWITTRAGGVRLLEAPKRELKDLQRQVLYHILDRIPPHPAAHGFRRGRSALTAARPHAGQPTVRCFDLESFFARVRAGRVYGVFRLAGYPEPVAHTLTALCTTVTPRSVLRDAPTVADHGVDRRRRLLSALSAPHLAQGAPTSPALANLVAYRLDVRMAGLAAHLGATYTRYADDLVLSGDERLRRLGPVDRAVAAVVRDEGFALHPGKSRRLSAAQRQSVLGLVVNERPRVSRREVDRLRAVLHDAGRAGPDIANRANHPDFRAHLLGRISRVAEADPARGARLHADFARIAWT